MHEEYNDEIIKKFVYNDGTFNRYEKAAKAKEERLAKKKAKEKAEKLAKAADEAVDKSPVKEMNKD